MSVETCVVCGKNCTPWLWLEKFKASACESCSASFQRDKTACRVCKGTKYVMVPYFYGTLKRFSHMMANSIDKTKLYYLREPCSVCNATGKRPKPIKRPFIKRKK